MEKLGKENRWHDLRKTPTTCRLCMAMVLTYQRMFFWMQVLLDTITSVRRNGA